VLLVSFVVFVSKRLDRVSANLASWRAARPSRRAGEQAL